MTKNQTQNMKILEKIQTRCEERKLQTKITTKELTLFDEEGYEIKKKRRHLLISIPEERDFKNIILIENDELSKIEESEFEKCKYIKGYEAIWSDELNIIECELQSDDNLRPPKFLLRRLFSAIRGQIEIIKKEDRTIIEFPSPNEKIKIFIGDCSIEYSILTNYKREIFYSINRLSNRPTIRIEGLEIKTHDEAKKVLLKIANSILFQIDLNLNLPFHLAPDRDMMRDMKRRKLADIEINFIPPKFEYDEEAMSLYWYARTSINLPLLQFLSFYQILEFYFPSFSYTEAQQKIKNLIKNPLFDINKDTDVAQIINIIKISAKGRSIGDEKTQLKATIHNVIDNESLISFLSENVERKNFFDITQKFKSLAKQKISFANHENDIRADVSNRIYEIRCRIVHTKDEDDMDLILPFSTDLVHLKYDIELIEFLAKKVLIATSRPLLL